MSKGTENFNVLCPFYAYDTGAEIVCEGITKSAYTHNSFLCDKTRNKYMEDFCCQQWSKCPLAKGLESKYE